MSRLNDRSTVRQKVAFAVIVVFVCICATGSVWGQDTIRRTIQVQGQARMSVEPDVAYLSLGVETQAETAAKAQAQLAERAANVLAALTRTGLDRAKITTSSYEVSPVYSTKPDKQNLIIGYKAGTTLTAEISNLQAVAQIMDAAIAAGSNSVRSVSYERSDMESYKERLIRDACADAAKKASAAAGALGVRLGVPVSVDVQDSFAARESGALMMAKAVASSDFLSPGQLDISVFVRVEFELLEN